MRIKNQEWVQFKRNLVEILHLFSQDADSIQFPDFDDDEFSLSVDGKPVHPVTTKKGDLMRLEYDFTFCPSVRVRTLCFSRYIDAIRVELTIKKGM